MALISAVLFDLDGTLMDHRGAAAAALRASLAASVTIDAARFVQLEERWSALERTHMDVFLGGGCTFTEQRRCRLRDFLPEVGMTAGGEAELDEWFVGYVRIYEANWALYSDVIGCLTELLATPAPPRLAVLTNGEHQQQCAKVDRCNLGSYFAQVLVSEDLGHAKPARECFAEACRRLEVAADNTVYIGDMVSIDARPATAAGMRGVWLDRRGSARDDYRPRVESLAELPALIQSYENA